MSVYSYREYNNAVTGHDQFGWRPCVPAHSTLVSWGLPLPECPAAAQAMMLQ